MKAIKLLFVLIIALSLFTVCDTPLGLEITEIEIVNPEVCETTGDCRYKMQLAMGGFKLYGDMIGQYSQDYDIVFNWGNGLGSKNIFKKSIDDGFCKIIGDTIQFSNGFEESGEYSISVTLNSREDGKSSSKKLLHKVALVVKKYTLTIDVKSEDGLGTYFYVYSADSYDDAEKMLDNFGQAYADAEILKGNPDEIADNYKYPFIWKPGCARVLDGDSKTFSSFYLLRVAVLRQAAQDGKAYGYYEVGECSQKYTVYFDLVPEEGQRRYFYVYETKTKAEAEKIRDSAEGQIENLEIIRGNCQEVAKNYVNIMTDAPICGNILEGKNETFSNFHKLRITVLQQAHKDGKAYGSFTQGGCPIFNPE